MLPGPLPPPPASTGPTGGSGPEDAIADLWRGTPPPRPPRYLPLGPCPFTSDWLACDPSHLEHRPCSPRSLG